jgi:capsular exopolysaccharide synthesis family protein
VSESPTGGLLPVLSQDDRMRQAAEQYRMVRTKIAQVLPMPFRLVITSPSIGDGKSVTALNLAAMLALRSKHRTLLIDADLRRASIHRSLQISPEPGLAEVLAGRATLQKALVQFRDVPGFYVLPAGTRGGKPVELLDSPRWRGLLAELPEQFSQVIVDCPPVDVVADYDLIADACDGVLLVLRPDHSDRTRSLATIERVKPKLTGVLINAAPEWFLWRKSGRYYDYYARGYKGE